MATHSRSLAWRIPWTDHGVTESDNTERLILCGDSLCIHTHIKKSIHFYRLPWWLSGKECSCQCRRHAFDPWVGKILWKRKWPPTPEFLPEEYDRQRSPVGYGPWGCKYSDTI